MKNKINIRDFVLLIAYTIAFLVMVALGLLVVSG
jgi:hypothetical protein